MYMYMYMFMCIHSRNILAQAGSARTFASMLPCSSSQQPGYAANEWSFSYDGYMTTSSSATMTASSSDGVTQLNIFPLEPPPLPERPHLDSPAKAAPARAIPIWHDPLYARRAVVRATSWPIDPWRPSCPVRRPQFISSLKMAAVPKVANYKPPPKPLPPACACMRHEDTGRAAVCAASLTAAGKQPSPPQRWSPAPPPTKAVCKTVPTRAPAAPPPLKAAPPELGPLLGDIARCGPERQLHWHRNQPDQHQDSHHRHCSGTTNTTTRYELRCTRFLRSNLNRLPSRTLDTPKRIELHIAAKWFP